ncbi:HD-GYP domain-containing protein [Desulfovibrio mangrovi]|uniref:HD-GYP domain-containing protein n=1 Tax=Desulfovibrio mangrovi TaxID=2976983 RepID=UPI00224651D3|nr:HD-GYP domain-containing protein [Desulfovibrio mangrovi]UZP67000.1 HD-GYP domain-containing protein [Desulfovibrio mangrovi]
MLKKIAIDDIRPGMYVVDSGLSWLEYPYLYMKEGMISSQITLNAIISEGYTEAVIDTELSMGAVLGGENGDEALSRDLEGLPEFFPPPPIIPVAEEMDKAKSVYSDTVRYARTLMDGVRMGKAIDLEDSSLLVEEIIGSVTRNCDALTGLSKLRTFDEYTFSHCVNVSVLSVVFGRFLGKTEDELRMLGQAGLFHDVGKQLVPSAVLNKPGRLTPEEFAVIKQHPLLGCKHLYGQDDGRRIEQAIMMGMLEHHEKFNGTGYPRGLSGDGISEMGRIIAVVDVYDALSSRRVYKAPMHPHKALGLMYSMRGKEFHPGYVERFIKCLGIYPVGSTVRLNTGHVAVVTISNPREPLHPLITVVADKAGPIVPRKLDLAGQYKVRIESTLDPLEVGIDPVAVLEKAA